ncbi:hypothetical protein [Agrobacterium tumefaciens]|uniref:DUF4376 domain-containing protein n=1 Tax=Agrobacterium tumefaciens TaxID=358 RepID=A0AAW8LVD5_AGRTU|nr:hypothetical protein [Agrobacterium tumefaciens]MDR6702997.1 hypothetical protein [Agrobacterium tumefaciens]
MGKTTDTFKSKDPRMFNPRDWYWRRDNGAVYSSARQTVVSKDDENYNDWLGSGYAPTRWPEDVSGQQTDAALAGVLSPYGLSVTATAIDAVRQARIHDLSARCESEITSGFVSEALGAAHKYPSGVKDQINLMGSVTDSLIPDRPADWQTPFWVCDTQGQWSFKPHSASQIQQAGRDGKEHIVNCQAQLEDLSNKVTAAKSVKAVEAISWPVT